MTRVRQSTVQSRQEVPFLQHSLILTHFICRKLGVQDLKELRKKLSDQREDWADDGHSYFFHTLKGIEGLEIPPDELASFDLRIKQYVERLNSYRSPKVKLKYFQYLAALFSEIYLNQLFNDRDRFLNEIRRFAQKEHQDLLNSYWSGEISYDDLTKIAFWMATGSGKTLIMHINLWQYLHYASGSGNLDNDNIILITPNAGLSRQHLEEFRKSGIAAVRYGEAETSYTQGTPPVIVIEITKLTGTKKGEGLSVEVDTFGPNNLLFVDEGHRGASGEVWRDLRAGLAERGFTFEYSATFGQIVNGASKAKRPALLSEYSKAILFDYSYPHFYDDGYGKEYSILNIRDDSDSFNEWIMLANLLSFYEQLLVFDEQGEAFRSYNLEKPLWLFVGHSVTGGKSRDDKDSLTDVEEIVAFFTRFLQNKDSWINRIDKLFRNETGLKDGNDEELFKDLFPYVRPQNMTPDRIYDEIMRRVFHSEPGGVLRAVALTAASGEIGLRTGADNPYFGVINIGDVGGLIKLLKAQGITCDEEYIADSLFDSIKEKDSSINTLIGSRKFMEGWDSFRVASMGLMNIGKGEGSQIIQLFGRGIRLWGKERSLKRSVMLERGDTPAHIKLLETLNVFGIRANYMAQFKEYLKQEGVEVDFETLFVPIQLKKSFLQKRLQVLRLKSGAVFQNDEGVILKADPDVEVTLDLLPRLEVARSSTGEEESGRGIGEDKSEEMKRLIPLLNLDRIYLNLLAYKRTRNLYNLSFTKASLWSVLKEGKYTVMCPDDRFPPSKFNHIAHTEDIAIGVLQKYISAFYERRRRSWERDHLQLTTLTKNDPNLAFECYTVKVKKDFIDTVRKLVEEADKLFQLDEQKYPHIHFDRHLYQPLLVSDKEDKISANPPVLDEHETQFVRDLRDYLHISKELTKDREIYLLRNLTRGKGIAFFEEGGGEAFHPDFILWIVEEKLQRIVFLDPHGLRMAKGGFNDPKIQTYKYLKLIEDKIQPSRDYRVDLTSFIISTSKYANIRKAFGTGRHSEEEFEQEHVLFQDEHGEYIGKLMSKILT